MSFGLLCLLVLLAFGGIAALEAERAHTSAGNATAMDAAAAASSFVVYRNTVLAYLEANQGAPVANGPLSNSQIAPYLPKGYSAATFPAGAGNVVLVGSGTLRTAYVFATMVPGELGALGDEFAGDASFGRVANGQWSSTVAGISGAVPGGVPDGAIISVVAVGEWHVERSRGSFRCAGWPHGGRHGDPL